MLKHVQSSSPFRRNGAPVYDQFERSSISGWSSGSSQSSSNLSLPEVNTSVIKVYCSVLRADVEYKTFIINNRTTSKDLVTMVLNKFKMKTRDPNLFYLTMEIGIRRPGKGYRSIIVLDDDAKPLELQACQPKGDSKFSLKSRRGGLIKVYDSCLMAGCLYKGFLISERTTCEELIKLILNCYNSTENVNNFVLVELCQRINYERKLHFDDCPLLIQQEWPVTEHCMFQLKRQCNELKRSNLIRPKSMDISLLRRQASSPDDEDDPIKLETNHNIKPSYNDYENYFYI